MTLYREERYEVKVSRTVLKTSLDWKQFWLSLTSSNHQNVVRAMFKGLISMSDPESIAAKRGKTVEDILG